MNSPSKRRKKNDGTVQPVRSLDWFFSKQKDGSKGPAGVPKIPKDVNGEGTKLDNGTSQGLTDEELARKLQDEWNQEDGEQSSRMVEDPPTQDAAPQEDNGGTEMTVPVPVLREDVSSQGPPPRAQKPSQSALVAKSTLSLQSNAADEDTISTSIPFDESPLTFNPSRYISELQGHWDKESGGRATYALLTRCFILVNETRSRIKIVDTLVNLLRTIIEGDPESLLPAVWLATNSISPPYIDLELGLGGSAISKALRKVCGLDAQGLRKLYDKYGDAGDVAFEAKKRQSFTLRKPKPLTIRGVFDSLVKIANSKGTGSVDIKQGIVERLLQDARGAEESRYVVRTLVQHLRIGAVKTTMLIGLARAFMLSKPPNADFLIRSQAELAALDKPSLADVYAKNEEIVKACFARRPNYNDLIPTLLEIGVCDELLLRCGLALHIPLRPMLGSITRDLGEMLVKLQGRDFSCEYKYDGQRAQVHCDERGKVTIFSRHLEIMTDKYPDLVALVPQIRGEGVSSFIMEGEVVAIDRESGELKAFQTLANRARKDVVIGSVKIDVCLFAFDLMYLNGEELLNRPFRERRSLLRSLFVEKPHHFTWVKSLDATSADNEAVSEFFKSATDIKCEGIMVKVLDNLPNPDLISEDSEKTPTPHPTPTKPKPAPTKSKSRKKSKPADVDAPAEKEKEKERGTRRKALLSTYEPDKRVDSWLKVKKDYNTSADTIDLIPIGAWHGIGRKCNWWSPILMAVRNPETGSLEAVTKCMAGFTDAFYKANKEKYNDEDEENTNVARKRPSFIEYGGTPAVWFEPQEVWEMAFADITLSPTYTAAIGLVSEERGLSLRFPRFLKVREDKSIDEASTSDFLAELWRKQKAKAPLQEKAGEKLEEVEDDLE
ncbi:DNA ligase 1 [Coniosporium apollinis CBS 100218]|uniref:DNA ligase n=1 Tax=Coniosporium apollinis (strain CBS 100218) TaxID=1168221 RepID=R7YYT6_CONA1|nr:DNA ligase 1 [Coniosporium apollinis CBS 100218]EON67013.1 DNA ligase 1 [Coniosporium apollinis CBS 100218]